jgi:hypothetical protein
MSKIISSILGFLCAVVVLSVLGYGIYLGLNKYSEYIKQGINSNLGITVGEIVSKHSYKGEGVSIRYTVNDKDYLTRIGVTSEFYDRHDIGSKIPIKYNTLDPNKIMVEE